MNLKCPNCKHVTIIPGIKGELIGIPCPHCGIHMEAV